VINRKVVDLTELKKPENEEFIKIIKIAKKALDKAFKPDLYNYATLGNWIRHHHWHIIPRYKKERKINRTVFRDNHWNNPAWPDPSKRISQETELIIYNKIKTNLK
jgi:diadenosine tetraphosphate (Ap4A) HIT family hydrolase